MSKTSIEIEGLRLSGGSGGVVVEVLRHGCYTKIIEGDPDWDYDYNTGERLSFSVNEEITGAELKRKFPRGKR